MWTFATRRSVPGIWTLETLAVACVAGQVVKERQKAKRHAGVVAAGALELAEWPYFNKKPE